ncbi:MAG: 2-hydroxyacyl-CoA dehydratase [Chloroflexi bacterium]|nr:2-hydroxyacyl-CoA dehydratase [Chloroflexota bacterium]
MDAFREWYEKRHEYQQDYKKRTGKKIVGYFCTYEPEELFYAADILPVRILGGHKPAEAMLSSAHIHDMFCPFCRDVLGQGLSGKYDYLDGIAIAQSCLHIRQAFFSWSLHKNPGWSHFLPMPHYVQNPKRAIPFLYEELKSLKKSLEDWTGKKITDDDLRHGIAVMNRDRRAMKKAFEFSKLDVPKITGLERMYMSASSFFVDKEEHAQMVEQALKFLEGREMTRDTGARLMMIGSEMDDVEFLKMVENSLPATMVIDEHCTTTRYFWDETDESISDPLLAIATREVNRTPCPTKDWPERKRFDRILQFAKDWRAQGAIVMQQAFCDPHEQDIPALRRFLEKNGIPTYFLEFDISVPVGQFKIRLEAFLEQISGLAELF